MCDARRVRARGRVAIGIAVVAALIGAAGAEVAPMTAERAAQIERARARASGDDLQPELPRGAGAVRTPGKAERGRDERAPAAEADDPESGSPLVRVLMWGAVVVGVVLIGAWLAGELSRYGGDAELAADEPAAAIAPGLRERVLDDADALARRGELAEAIHTLLLRTLQELVRTSSTRLAPATTSREVLARVAISADARGALAALIGAVERTHFGGAPATLADYEGCRDRFHAFVAAARAGAGSTS
jgi:hypothetical protein